MQDPILKSVFAIPKMVELLARRYRPDLASKIDFSTLSELPNELLTDQLDKRVPDMLFLANCRGESRRVLFHIEFQAGPDAETIAGQLRPVLASLYDHSLLEETSPMATMLEVFTAARDAERASDRHEARLEGQARTIVRLATQRFGPETARRLSRLLVGVNDPDRMDCVAEAVIDCGGGGEFLAQVGALLQADQT